MSKKPLLLIVIGVVLIIIWYMTTQGFFRQSNNQTPVGTPSPTVSQSADVSGAPQGSNKQRLNIYMVAVGDEGKSGTKIGCGDSLIPVIREVPTTKAVLKTALTELFSVKEQYFGESGLLNALYSSDLQVESAVIENGKATVKLSGQLSLSGVCDNPRVEGQIKATVMQFSSVKTVEIFLNGKPLSEALTLK